MDTNWNKRTDTVRITDLRKGTVFQCISGKWWKIVRHADNATHVESLDGKPELFANCATVIPKADGSLYCDYCQDALADPDDPTGQADCRHCGGSFAWRQREAFASSQG